MFRPMPLFVYTGRKGNVAVRTAPPRHGEQGKAPLLDSQSKLLSLLPSRRVCLLSDSVLDPSESVPDDFIFAVLVENLMEQAAVDLHLLILGRGRGKELISVLHADQPILLPVEGRRTPSPCPRTT